MPPNHGFPFQDQIAVDLGKRTVPVRITGSGTPCLFLHGFPLDSRMWMTVFARLSADYLCIAPDLRGFGGAPAERFSFSLQDLATDCNVLLEKLKIRQPTVVCGLSMGGYVAMQFNHYFPERVSHLILTNTRANADDSAGVEARLKTAQQALILGSQQSVGPMLQKLILPECLKNNQQLTTEVESMIHSTRPSTIAWAQLAMAQRPSFLETMKQWNIPTLCIAGSNDPITPPSVVQSMHHAIRHSRYVEIPQSAHLSPMEQPDLFASEVHQFIASTPR